MSAAIVWFRRDLRLADNPALAAAIAAHDIIVPVYIHAPDEEAPRHPGGLPLVAAPCARRPSRQLHGRLLIRRGASLATLQELVEQFRADGCLLEPPRTGGGRPRQRHQTGAACRRGEGVERQCRPVVRTLGGGDPAGWAVSRVHAVLETPVGDGIAVARCCGASGDGTSG